MKKTITLLMAFGFVLLSSVGWGQTTVSYDFSALGAVTGLNEASPGIALDANIGFGSFKNSGTSNPAIVSEQLRLYQNATKGGSIKIYASNGVTITQVIVHASGTTGPAAFTVDGGVAIDLPAGTTYTMSGLTATSEVEFYQKDGSSSNRIYVDDFEVTYTSGGGSSPTITIAPASLAGFTYLLDNGPSAEQSFTVAGSDLTADITLTPPASYEISETSGSGYTSGAISLTQSEGSVVETTIWVRLKAGLAIGDYNNEDITATSTDADNKTVTCSGNVTDPNLNVEDFANYPETGTSYNTGTFLGQDGSTWNYVKCAGSSAGNIDAPSPLLGRNQTPSAEIYSGTISGGIGTLSFEYMQVFGTNVDLNILVNDNIVGNVTSSSQQSVVLNSGDIIVNVVGDFVLEFAQNGSGGQVSIDNVTWTPYTAGGNLPPSITNIIQTPSADITSTTAVAVQADVAAGEAPIDWVQLYWGTSSGGWDNEIPMVHTEANTYIVEYNIDAQPNGTTVYYVVAAQDEDEELTISPEQSYTVRDPATTTLPYANDFSLGEFGDIYTYTVAGSKPWEIASGGAQANGFGGEATEEHWMVLPGIDFDTYSGEVMTFTTYAQYGAVDGANYLKLFYSADYPGIGDPTTFTWTELPFDQPAGINSATEESAPSGSINLSGVAGESVYLAFKYYSTDTPTRWRVDDIAIEEEQVAVTFYVDMSNEVGTFTNVDIAGSFNNWGDPVGDNLTLVDDNIYSFTTNADFAVGSEIGFKFRKDGNWATSEPGGNRTYTVVPGDNSYHAVYGVQIPAEITYANLQWPGSGAINSGDNFNVYAQVYANQLTGDGDVPNMQAWIGYSTVDTDPSSWESGNWFVASYGAGDHGDNDEYMFNLGAEIATPGTFYYASRFKLGMADYVYGGFNGGFWNGTTNVSGVLNILGDEPEAHPTAFSAEANSESTIAVSWTDAVPAAVGYLIKGSDIGYESIADPVNGIPETNAALVQNVANGTEIHHFTGLDAATTYYFKIFPYNGADGGINYKTDGTVPQASATTLAGPLYYHVGFESANSEFISGSTGYSLGVYDLNGLRWEVGPEALIGTDASDMKQGVGSARLRLSSGVFGSITMIEDKAGGIGSISFVYGRSNFAGDRTGVAPSFVLEYALDGTEVWTQVGEETSLEGVDQFRRFTAMVNADGNARVRIRQTAGDSGKRWNVDEIVITNYNSISYFADMNLASGFDTETDVVYMAGEMFGGWQEPGSNPGAMMERLGLSPVYIKAMPATGGDKNGPYEYKYFVNAGWGGGEWGVVPNRMITPADGSIVNDLYGYVTFSGDGPVSEVANWNAVAVPSERNVLVRGNMQINQAFTAQAMIIESDASVSILPSQALTVYNLLSNRSGTAGLVIESDATGTGSLFHSTADVPATVERYINGGGYHLVSVPITQASSPEPELFLHSYLFRFDAAIQDWDGYGNNPFAITVDQGYMINYTGASTTYSFAGSMHQGDFVASTPAAASVFNNPNYDGGYNLVPNPYPSAINWNAAGGFTETNLFGTIWIYNRNTGNYGSYVRDAGSGTNGVSNVIPVGQSFFVQANTDGVASLTIKQDARMHSANNILKDAGLPLELLKLRADANSLSDELVIQFNEAASMDFEGNSDAQKLRSPGSAPQLYSLTPAGTELSINTIPYNSETIIIPLGFELAADEAVSFNFAGLESFDAAVDIFLEDKLTVQMINLRENPSYSFSHIQNNDAHRFRLHFMGVTGTEELAQSNDHHIWSHEDKLYIHIPDLSGEQVQLELYDLMGRQLTSNSHNLGQPSIISVPYKGVVIARIVSGNRVYTNKLIIR